MITRRHFLQQSLIITASSSVPLLYSCKNQNDQAATMAHHQASQNVGDLDKFGIQLYTLRDIIGDDPKGTLEKIASFGFQQIESYQGDQGMFWGMTPKDFKYFVNDLGMEVVSSHCNIFEGFEKTVDDAATAGLSYLICPYVGPQTSVQKWQAITEKFNECGRICQEHGIRFAYHNHEYTFIPFSGMIPQDFLMDNTDPELVDHQMDIYWVVTGGADPADYFKKYPGRFKLCHVKDRAKNASPNNKNASCTLGTGMIDYSSILKVAKENGMDYFILEQEKYDNTTPLGAAKTGAKYLQELKFL